MAEKPKANNNRRQSMQPSRIEKVAAKANANEASFRRAGTSIGGPKNTSQVSARKVEQDDKTPTVPEVVEEAGESQSFDSSSSGSGTKETRAAPTVGDVKAFNDMKLLPNDSKEYQPIKMVDEE